MRFGSQHAEQEEDDRCYCTENTVSHPGYHMELANCNEACCARCIGAGEGHNRIPDEKEWLLRPEAETIGDEQNEVNDQGHR